MKGDGKPTQELAYLRARVRYLESLMSENTDAEGPDVEETQAGNQAPYSTTAPVGFDAAEREALLAEAEAIAQLGSWFWDTQRDAVRWSDGLYRLMGLSRSQVQPGFDTFLQRIHPADRALFLQTNRAVSQGVLRLRDGMLPRIQVRLIREDGEIRLVELSGRVVESDQGRPLRVVGTARDVTHANAALSAAEEAAEILRMANRIQGLATWRWSMDTGEVKWSDHMFTLLGVPKSTPPSLHAMAEAIHPDDQGMARFVQEVGEIVGDAGPLELRFVRSDGEVRHIVSSFGSFSTAEHQGGMLVVGIFVDVTDRRLLEERLRKAQKMEALGRMAGGVAHDVNNYLTVAMGNAELLRASIAPDQKELLLLVDEIDKASQRCSSMTQQLLAFGRRKKETPNPIDLCAQMQAHSAMLRCLIGPQVELKLELEPQGCWARLDDAQFEKVMMNLAANGRDAMPEGGTLTVRCSTHGDATKVARIEVSDTGTGMDEETRERVFDPFFTTKPMGHGAGLGLSIVYGIVERYGGDISVQSVAGLGTSFVVEFPGIGTEEGSS